MENLPLTKKQRRELKKQEQAAMRMSSHRRQKIIKTSLIVFLPIVLAAAVFIGVRSRGSNGQVLNANTNFTRPIFGAEQSKVIIKEFSDFQCPACREVEKTTIKEVKNLYADKIRFEYYQYPLPQHKNAFTASQAALASSVQGEFWEYHDLLFEKQDEWANLSNPSQQFEKYASDLGLDLKEFKSVYNSKATKNQIKSDRQEGDKAGVQATPTFFINGQKIEGAAPLDTFKAIIDPLLTASS